MAWYTRLAQRIDVAGGIVARTKPHDFGMLAAGKSLPRSPSEQATARQLRPNARRKTMSERRRRSKAVIGPQHRLKSRRAVV
jgi:hypothetical protein